MHTRRYLVAVARVLAGGVLVAALVTAPTAAQTTDTVNPVCRDDTDTLAQLLEGFVRITTGIGMIGLLVVWQADSLMQMFQLSRDQKARLKEHKRGAIRSAAVLLVLPPLFTVSCSAMGLPVARCVDLVPF
jgi:hypothetical protein